MLHLSGNKIQDFSVLTKLPKLEALYLNEDSIEEIPKELSEIPQLKTLYLAYNPIENIDVLGQIPSLEALNLEDSNIRDYQVLENLAGLYNQVSH